MLPTTDNPSVPNPDYYIYEPNEFTVPGGAWLLPSTNVQHPYSMAHSSGGVSYNFGTRTVAFVPFLLQKETKFDKFQIAAGLTGVPIVVGLYASNTDKEPTTVIETMFSGNITANDFQVNWSKTLQPGLYYVGVKNCHTTNLATAVGFGINSYIHTLGMPGCYNFTDASTALTLPSNPTTFFTSNATVLVCLHTPIG